MLCRTASTILFSLATLLAWPAILCAQSTFDLQPPLQASTNSSQVTMSPDPDALPVFRFATAEINDKGLVSIATKEATQTLVAPMPETVPPDLDPRGVRYTETISQDYIVTVTFTEQNEEGEDVVRTRKETRTRTAPVIKFRKRNAEEQAAFEKRLAEQQEDQADEDAPSVEPAVATQVTQQYTVHVPKQVEVDGETITRTQAERRQRTIVVYRGKTETTASVSTRTFPISKLKFHDVEGQELGEAAVKARLGERQPVILVNSTVGITPFFRNLLSPEAIFIIEPQE